MGGSWGAAPGGSAGFCSVSCCFGSHSLACWAGIYPPSSRRANSMRRRASTSRPPTPESRQPLSARVSSDQKSKCLKLEDSQEERRGKPPSKREARDDQGRGHRRDKGSCGSSRGVIPQGNSIGGGGPRGN